ncbi:MAG: hypothetical protein U5Q44_11620 [Dehalococcoidia bacterium]|nr:hypothetical protein [Dehalococcoidia bacterium]
MATPRPMVAQCAGQARALQLARLFAGDFAIVLAVIGGYFLLAGVAPTRVEFAVELTTVLIAIERALGIYVEPEYPGGQHPVALVEGVRQLRLRLPALPGACGRGRLALVPQPGAVRVRAERDVPLDGHGTGVLLPAAGGAAAPDGPARPRAGFRRHGLRHGRRW